MTKFKLEIPAEFHVHPQYRVELPKNHAALIYPINVEAFKWVVIARDCATNEIVDIPFMNNPERMTCPIDVALWLEQAMKNILNPPDMSQLHRPPRSMEEFIMQEMGSTGFGPPSDPNAH